MTIKKSTITSYVAFTFLALAVSSAHFYYASHGWHAALWAGAFSFSASMFVSRMTVHVIVAYSEEFVRSMDRRKESER